MHTNIKLVFFLISLTVTGCAATFTNLNQKSNTELKKFVTDSSWYTTTGAWHVSENYIVATGCAEIETIISKTEGKIDAEFEAVDNAKQQVLILLKLKKKVFEGVQTIATTCKKEEIFATILVPFKGTKEKTIIPKK